MRQHSAVVIQKHWRGYQVRQKNKRVLQDILMLMGQIENRVVAIKQGNPMDQLGTLSRPQDKSQLRARLRELERQLAETDKQIQLRKEFLLETSIS